MIGLLIGCATNIILDPIFIFVCQWGVKGAAWATILGQILNAAFFAVCLFRFKTIKLKREYFVPRLQIAKRLASLGVSSLISQIASVFVIAVTNNLLVTYGAASPYGPDIPMAVFGIVMKVSSLVSGITLGLAAGVQPILGYNYGRVYRHAGAGCGAGVGDHGYVKTCGLSHAGCTDCGSHLWLVALVL